MIVVFLCLAIHATVSLLLLSSCSWRVNMQASSLVLLVLRQDWDSAPAVDKL